MFSTTDTIVAIATAAGHGGIGVVRIAGPMAPAIGRALVGRAQLLPRRATFGRIREGTGPDARTVDDVVVTWFESPRSYTGDDVVEIGAHGSPVVLQRIVQLVTARGARMAEPGEFTFRAYLNGRLDLAQAEAVADLVDAVTPLQARAAVDQLEGTLTREIASIEAALFDLVAKLEASLDFPEEGFHFVTREEAVAELDAVRARLDALAADGRRGRMIREGALVAIAGRPNAGKSSLFNALVGTERAIVTSIPGTTRDVLTERVDIGGMPVTLVDTAGLRAATDDVEAEGVRRAREAHGVARLVVLVLDGSSPIGPEDESLLDAHARDSVVAVNKRDLPAAWLTRDVPWANDDVVDVSARTGAGLEDLRARIVAKLTRTEDHRETPALTNVRHLSLVDAARAAATRAAEALGAGATEELALAELAAARDALEAIVGRKAPDDLLRRIFSRFCIGK